jgi:hypothetical protein
MNGFLSSMCLSDRRVSGTTADWINIPPQIKLNITMENGSQFADAFPRANRAENGQCESS